MFDTATYIDRRRKLAAGMDSGLALFLGNDEAPLNYRDNHYHFRQDSSYLYFWGLNEANLAGTIDFDSGEEVLYGYEPTLDDIVWTGPLPTLGERGERVGVSDCRNIERLKADVQAALSAGRTVHLLPTYRGDTTLKLAALLDVEPAKLAGMVSEPLVRSIISLRAAKEPQEIVEMEKALEGDVKSVRFTARLKDSAAVLVTEGGLSQNLERILRRANQDVPESERTLELNPDHALIAKLEELHKGDGGSERLAEYAELLYGQALLAEGSPLKDAGRFASLVTKLMVG